MLRIRSEMSGIDEGYVATRLRGKELEEAVKIISLEYQVRYTYARGVLILVLT